MANRIGRPGLIAAVIVAVAAAAAAYYWTSRDAKQAPTYRFARVERGPLTATVAASGTLNPVTSVQVGTQVSGQVKELFVDFNSPVKAGQLIARIDPETFQYRVRQNEADLEAARAAVARAQVSLVNAQRELSRTRELVQREFVSPADLDRAQAQFDLAKAEVNNVQAVVAQRAAQLASARVDLARTEIRAPVDGVVIKRSVDVGQTVAASLQAPELFVIARDLRDMQVETSIDEADVGRMRVGQRATFTVDAFPGRTFSGEVRQVRKSAQTVQNVVTYTVLVSAANPDGQLMPGMTANVRIVTDTRESVLKVANAALRFRPPGESAAPADARAAAEAPPAGGGGAQMQQLRERLVAELKLDEAQQARVQAIFEQMRGRFTSLRELPEEARGKAMATARAEMRAGIEEVLKPEQKPLFAQIMAEATGRSGQAGRGRLWVLDDGRPKAIDVRTGLTDGSSTEVSGTGIDEGREVISAIQGGASAAPAARSGAPRMFF
ncbi:MAG: efflux RND transporter periplasmic adaptor subunit [Burkholderiales bacterium]|nr:efflux RND transporter periplasmic adaptor subunit [Burkholderiales bacterium]